MVSPEILAAERAAAAVVLAVVEGRDEDAALLLGRDEPATRELAYVAFMLAMWLVKYHRAADVRGWARHVIDTDNREEGRG